MKTNVTEWWENVTDESLNKLLQPIDCDLCPALEYCRGDPQLEDCSETIKSWAEDIDPEGKNKGETKMNEEKIEVEELEDREMAAERDGKLCVYVFADGRDSWTTNGHDYGGYGNMTVRVADARICKVQR